MNGMTKPCEHAVWSYTSGKSPTGYWSRPTTCDCEWPEDTRPVAVPQAPRRRRVRTGEPTGVTRVSTGDEVK